MEKIKAFLNEKDYKVLVSNFLSLAVLQGLNILLPFLTIPYLLRVVGVEKFGLISFALAFVTFFQIVVEYGFNNTATRDISVVSEKKKDVERIFSEVLTAKIFLLVVCTVVFLLTVLLIPKFSGDRWVYIFTYLSVVGQTIFPIWLFQGIQQMKYITYLNVLFKTIFTIAIFFFVNKSSDYQLAPLFTSLGFLFSGVSALVIVNKKFGYSFRIASLSRIKYQLIKGKYLFFSEFQIALIANLNVLIIGFLLNNTAVGYYATAEKVIRAVSNFQAPIINAVYPYISKLMINDKNKAIRQIKKIAYFGVIIDIIGAILLFISADFIFSVLFGEPNKSSVVVFRIMILFPMLSFLDQVFGKLVLLTNGKEKLFFSVFFFTSIISVLFSFSFTYFFGFIGTSVSNVIAQLLLVIGMWYYSRPFFKYEYDTKS
ncbi:flippase [Myroides odoratimimus]|uniref:flippase n=1 Tax=Myroides odoratimimus TaxID=76832 RepID=UPI0031013A16